MKEITFWIGITKDKELIKATMSLNDYNEKQWWSLNTESYGGILTDEEGEERAREYLKDGEMWRMAVEGENTTLGLNDWADEVLNIVGWEQTLDVVDLGEYFISWDCLGGFDENKKADYEVLFISKSEFDLFFSLIGRIYIGSKTETQLLELFKKVSNEQNETKIAQQFRDRVAE